MYSEAEVLWHFPFTGFLLLRSVASRVNLGSRLNVWELGAGGCVRAEGRCQERSWRRGGKRPWPSAQWMSLVPPPPQCPQIWPGFPWSGADSVKMVKGVPAPHHLCFCHGGWLLRAGQAGAGPFWLDLIWGQRVLESGGSRVGVRRGSAPRAPSRNCRLAVPGSVPRALPSPASLTCLDARGTRAVGLLSTREVHLT